MCWRWVATGGDGALRRDAGIVTLFMAIYKGHFFLISNVKGGMSKGVCRRGVCVGCGLIFCQFYFILYFFKRRVVFSVFFEINPEKSGQHLQKIPGYREISLGSIKCGDVIIKQQQLRRNEGR